MAFGNIVTLNIESSEVRFLVLQGRRVAKWGTIPLEPGLVKEGLIQDVPAVSKVLSEFMAEQGLKGREVVASLSGFQSIQRILDLPRLSAKLTREAILREAKRVMPIPVEQLYLSWQGVGSVDETQRIFLLGIPQNLVDAEVQCFRQAGFTPTIVDLKPLALARVVTKPDALIIDVEAESADIIVLSGGIPTIMRTLTMRPEYPLGRRVQYMAEEFERTLQFYESSHPNEPLSRSTPLFLTGGLLIDPEVYRAVAGALDRQAEPLVAPVECPPDLPLTQYAANFGLAIKRADLGEDVCRVNVNVLPDVYRPRGLPTRQLLLVAGVLAGMALLFPMYQLAASAARDVYAAQSEKSALEQQLQVRQLDSKKVQQVQDAIAQTQKRAQSLQTELNGIAIVPSVAYDNLNMAANTALPTDATIIGISYKGDQMTVRGEVPSYDIALEYAYALRQTQRFSTVWLSSAVTDAQTGNIVFEVTLKAPRR